MYLTGVHVHKYRGTTHERDAVCEFRYRTCKRTLRSGIYGKCDGLSLLRRTNGARGLHVAMRILLHKKRAVLACEHAIHCLLDTAKALNLGVIEIPGRVSLRIRDVPEKMREAGILVHAPYESILSLLVVHKRRTIPVDDSATLGEYYFRSQAIALATLRVCGPLHDLEICCLGSQEREREHHRKTNGAERALAYRPLKPSLETALIEPRQVRRIEENLVWIKLKPAPASPKSPEDHPSMIRVFTKRCTSTEASVAPAPKSVKYGMNEAPGV